jgi:hypothetical protein
MALELADRRVPGMDGDTLSAQWALHFRAGLCRNSGGTNTLVGMHSRSPRATLADCIMRPLVALVVATLGLSACQGSAPRSDPAGPQTSSIDTQKKTVWEGVGYVVRRHTGPADIDWCFGAIIGTDAGNSSVDGCAGVKIVGFNFDEYLPWVWTDMDVLIARLRGSFSSDRSEFTATVVTRLPNETISPVARPVPKQEAPACITPSKPLNEGVKDSRTNSMPLGIVGWGAPEPNGIDNLYALGVDRAWFEKACAEGLPIAEVFDYLTPV